ncbi:uncharacterized protein THITE_2108119 [Thermothielavioides terrestris NRRL 8126]|uniref:Uncharacterized protein n=1 Tax=Thermothielavioides terrestris (strain ATCC 38088 / NRRL 8126) TaxID=578455 RepID=G2QXT7_THETT|nr:uncharacterized protein THITE_2108119 [Thermothielavioides terrestris NRRL 8126]AEO63205.1 hypothetical protein THITE_2108119 [Thermothielavioides terrestris NRRL 8126]
MERGETDWQEATVGVSNGARRQPAVKLSAADPSPSPSDDEEQAFLVDSRIASEID